MSAEPTPTKASLAARQIASEVRHPNVSWRGAALIIDAALAAEYKRGMMEALDACIGCGATKDEDCHCGETDEVEL
jgi:hypothetical protein